VQGKLMGVMSAMLVGALSVTVSAQTTRPAATVAQPAAAQGAVAQGKYEDQPLVPEGAAEKHHSQLRRNLRLHWPRRDNWMWVASGSRWQSC